MNTKKFIPFTQWANTQTQHTPVKLGDRVFYTHEITFVVVSVGGKYALLNEKTHAVCSQYASLADLNANHQNIKIKERDGKPFVMPLATAVEASIGMRIRTCSDETYVVGAVEYGKINLIDINTGCRYGEPVVCTNPFKIPASVLADKLRKYGSLERAEIEVAA